MSTDENYGYILRISKDDWEEQVYDIKKYYTAIMRGWRRGSTILLARKKEEGDSFIGYGVVGKVERLWELPPEEEAYCQENNWRCVVTFKSLNKFKKPFPIKESILSDDPRKGMFLHGARFTEEQIDAILEAAEDYQG